MNSQFLSNNPFNKIYAMKVEIFIDYPHVAM